MGEQALNEAGATPTPAADFIEYGDGLVSTTEYSAPKSPAESTDTTSKGDAKPEAKDDAEKASTDEGTASKEEPGAKGGRLDRDSRFAQVVKTNRDLKQQLDSLTQKLDALAAKPAADPKSEDDGKILGMTRDELLDLQATDPGKYHQLLVESITKQAEEKATAKFQETASKQSFEAGISKTYEAYAKANPDFDEMWDAGEIQSFMEKNPGHNAISAHQALTVDQRIADAKAQAEKDALAKIRADLRTKGKAAVLGSGPSGQVANPDQDQDLKDPKKFGGMYAVLARRSAARRAG
jgi:hypothetical protein